MSRITFSRVAPDKATQPGRIYNIFKTGDFIAWDRTGADALTSRGFNTFPFFPQPNSGELEYLLGIDKRFNSGTLWYTQCQWNQWEFPNGDFVCSAVQPPNTVPRKAAPGLRTKQAGIPLKGNYWWLALGLFGAGSIYRAALQSKDDTPF